MQRFSIDARLLGFRNNNLSSAFNYPGPLSAYRLGSVFSYRFSAIFKASTKCQTNELLPGQRIWPVNPILSSRWQPAPGRVDASTVFVA